MGFTNKAAPHHGAACCTRPFLKNQAAMLAAKHCYNLSRLSNSALWSDARNIEAAGAADSNPSPNNCSLTNYHDILF